MTKPGYYQIRLTDETEAHIRQVCKGLGLDPDKRGSYTKAINFALRTTRRGKREMYKGNDRVRQVNCLRQLAADISYWDYRTGGAALAGEGTTEELVDYYMTKCADELPGWFDDHDKMLLVRFVGDD